jgi:uncharacterized protein (DUF697 family)
MGAEATKVDAERRARMLVDRWAKAALFTGWIPGSTIPLAGADVLMIRQVGEAFGIPAFDEDALKAHLGGVLGSVAGGAVAEAVGFVPLVGWAVKSYTMHTKADALGKAVIDYFRQRSPLPETVGETPA